MTSLEVDIDDMEKVLKCGIYNWPMCYLGMPIVISAKRRVFWDPLVTRIKSIYAKWKADSMNQAGRLTLVKSVLAGINGLEESITYPSIVVLVIALFQVV